MTFVSGYCMGSARSALVIYDDEEVRHFLGTQDGEAEIVRLLSRKYTWPEGARLGFAKYAENNVAREN